MAGLKPSQVTTFVLLFLGYGCYMYNRKSVSFALPTLIGSALLDKSGAGSIASSQNTAYAISKFWGGVLSDKISARWLFFSGLFLSGAAAVCFSWSDSVLFFVVCWFLNGFAQGAGWPACAKLLKNWFSPEQFGTFWSALSASSNVAGSVGPFVAAWLISSFGWNTSVSVAARPLSDMNPSLTVSVGGVSILASLLIVALVKDTPNASDGILSVSSLSQSKGQNNAASSMGWTDLVNSRFMWLVSGCYLVVFAARTSVVDWGQMYLIEDLGHSPFLGSAFISSVETGGFVGGIGAGYVTDILVKQYSGKTQGNPRMWAASFFMVAVAASLSLLTTFLSDQSSQIVVTSLGFVLGAGLYGCIAIFGIVASESYPSHLSGTAHAIAALAANVGAILSGLPFSYIAQMYSWRAVFILLQTVAWVTVAFMLATRHWSAQAPTAAAQKKNN